MIGDVGGLPVLAKIGVVSSEEDGLIERMLTFVPVGYKRKGRGVGSFLWGFSLMKRGV